MKHIPSPVGCGEHTHPWPPEGSLVMLDNRFILLVTHDAEGPHGICVRDWEGGWYPRWHNSGRTFTSSAVLLEEGDSDYDQALAHAMRLMLLGELTL